MSPPMIFLAFARWIGRIASAFGTGQERRPNEPGEGRGTARTNIAAHERRHGEGVPGRRAPPSRPCARRSVETGLHLARGARVRPSYQRERAGRMERARGGILDLSLGPLGRGFASHRTTFMKASTAIIR